MLFMNLMHELRAICYSIFWLTACATYMALCMYFHSKTRNNATYLRMYVHLIPNRFFYRLDHKILLGGCALFTFTMVMAELHAHKHNTVYLS